MGHVRAGAVTRPGLASCVQCQANNRKSMWSWCGHGIVITRCWALHTGQKIKYIHDLPIISLRDSVYLESGIIHKNLGLSQWIYRQVWKVSPFQHCSNFFLIWKRNMRPWPNILRSKAHCAGGHTPATKHFHRIHAPSGRTRNVELVSNAVKTPGLYLTWLSADINNSHEDRVIVCG